MALPADEEGFLKGEPLVLETGAFERALSIWHEIKSDIAEIRHHVVKGTAQAARVRGAEASRTSATPVLRVVEPERRSRTVTNLPPRDALGRFTKRSTPRAAEPAPQGAAASVPRRAQVVALPERERNGRFTRRPGSDPANPDSAESPQNQVRRSRDKESLAAEVAKNVVSGIAESVQGTEQIDPALMAAKEIKDVVAPLTRPFAWLVKRDDKQDPEEEVKPHVPWYKRMLKHLKQIDESSKSGIGGIGLSFPGGMGLGAGIGAAAAFVGGLLARAGKALLRRVPILGTLLGLGQVGKSLLGDDVPRVDRFRGAGGGLGMLLGGGIGTFLGGPLGAVVGAAIGDVVGTKVGEWLSTVNWADVGKDISETWESTATWFRETWGSISSKVGQWIDDLLSLPGKAADAVGNAASSAAEKAAGAWDRVQGLWGGGSKGRRQALLNELSAQGITNANEQAMFLAQAGHETAGFSRLEENLNYRSAEQVMAVSASARTHGRAAVEAAIKKGPEAVAELMYGGRMGNTAPGDAYKYRGRGFLQITGKAMYAEAGNALGLDLVNNPELAADPAIAAQIATWYWKSRNLSAPAQAGDVSAVTRAINGGLNGITDRRAQFANYQSAITSGSLRSTAPSVPRTDWRSVAPSVERMTPPPPPPVRERIGSNNAGPSRVEVNIPLQVGQNLSDRAIAHVATGGIASGMGGN